MEFCMNRGPSKTHWLHTPDRGCSSRNRNRRFRRSVRMAERRLLGAELADAMFDWVSEERAAEAQAFEDMCHEAEAQAE